MFANLFLGAFALPAVQQFIPFDNTTLTDDTNSSITTLTPSTIAPTVKSRPGKELTQLEVKFKALGCEVPMMPVEIELWKNNQTYEMILPTKVSAQNAI